MVKVFLYEYITGGGAFETKDSAPPSGSLLREGMAMIQAVARDFAALDDCEPTVFQDARLPPLSLPKCRGVSVTSSERERALFTETARQSDWTLLIAPEIGGALSSRVELALGAGARLLSPGAKFVALASDKHATCQRLASAGIPVPAGNIWRRGEPSPNVVSFPAVVKPLDGAGSWNVRLVDSPQSLAQMGEDSQACRVETWHRGLPVSVSVLCGENVFLPLPASRQTLAADGCFTYLGGELPLPAPLRTRATRLAVAALRAMPSSRGYVGVDLVLGVEENGAGDVVIEINPRLTTSYVGLREVVQGNLAQGMMRLATGDDWAMEVNSKSVRFQADGRVDLR